MVMSKKRIVLFSVLGCFLLSGVLSIVGVIPNKFAVIRKKETAKAYRGKSYTELQQGAREESQVNQYISDFYLPSYDESGKEIFTLRGKEAVLVNDQVYNIDRPEIRLKGTTEDTGASEPQDIVITSRKGEMDKVSNIGVLTKNVVVRLGDNTTLKTKHLTYYPDRKRAHTDSPVVVQGERMNIEGEGMEAELFSGRMWIERSVVAEIKDTESNLFVVSFGESGEKENKPERVYIRCSGKMVFEKEPNMVTFHDNVKVRKGNSTMTSDKMVIIFGDNSGKPKMIVAEGNVTASEGKKVAKGDSLFWDAVTDATTLKGTPNAAFFEEKTSIVSPKIVFHQKDDKVNAPKGGQLTTKGFEDEGSGDGMLGSGNVTIAWKGGMSFEKSEGQAVFEKDVQLSRKDFKINSQELIVGFNQGEELKVKNLVAKGGAYMVEKKGANLREVYGNEAHWDMNTGRIEVLGEGTLYIQGKEGSRDASLTNISWTKKMVRDERNKKISFFENVLALKGRQQVECNRLNAFINETNEVRRVVALGDVVYSDTKEGGIEGIGDILEWDWKLNKMILSGTPTAEVRRKKARTFAKRVYYDPKTQRLSWKEKPHWQIPLEGRDAGKTLPITPY
ncbi:MAG: LPS export ABC transporter periplasmic protein LptC [Candidatus Brocadiales bacterium]